MKGLKCRCGFSTVSQRRSCPRCGREMSQFEWPDEGRVLSFTELGLAPEGMNEPRNMVLVSIKKGPKMICWVSGKLNEDDEVVITETDGVYHCKPKTT